MYSLFLFGFDKIPIFIVFCFLEKRVKLWPAFLNGRPGLAIPVNLVDTFEDRLAFAIAFSCIAVLVFNLIVGLYIDDEVATDIDMVPDMLQGTLFFLKIIGLALLACASSYPLMVCLSTNYKLIGNTIGLFYCVLWTSYYVAGLLGCTPGVIGLLQSLTGAWVNGPACTFYVILTLRFLYGLVRVIYRSRFQRSVIAFLGQKSESLEFKDTHFYQRTKYLLSRPLPEQYGGNVVSRVLQKYIYFVKGFKYSRQNICVLAMALFLTYLLSISYATIFWILLDGTGKSLKRSILKEIKEFDALVELITTVQVTFWIACGIAVVGIVLSNVDAQMRYRTHTLQLWRGDRSFYATVAKGNESVMVNSLRYIGFRISFMILGYIIMHLFAWTVCLLVKYLFVLLMRQYWLTVVMFIILYIVQVIMNHLLFLQKDEDQVQSLNIFRKRTTYLGLDNRRIFHMVVYFTLFVNILIGILKGVIRLIKSMVIGVILVGRVDRCAMQHGWESMDVGYNAYVSFLQLEVAHTHPVVITFCHLMNQVIQLRTLHSTPQNAPGKSSHVYVNEGPSVLSPPDVPEASHRMSSRVRNRWLLALTLSRNPVLIPTRKKPKVILSV